MAPAEDSGLKASSADLVTVAQALHWFDLSRFYREVERVLVPRGAFAAWFYNRLTIDPAVDTVVRRFYEEIVGPYWPPERALVENGYKTIPFPLPEIDPVPDFSMEERWDALRLLGYFGTWSATRRFQEATGRDPLEVIRADLLDVWGDPASKRTVRWPLRVRVGQSCL